MKYYYQLDSLNRFSALELEREEFINGILNWPTIELENIDNIILDEHGLINGEIVYIGKTQEETKDFEKQDKISELNILKKQLNSTDYKVIKCYEAQLLNENMPYNLQELLSQRQAWRDQINQLEFEISMLG